MSAFGTVHGDLVNFVAALPITTGLSVTTVSSAAPSLPCDGIVGYVTVATVGSSLAARVMMTMSGWVTPVVDVIGGKDPLTEDGRTVGAGGSSTSSTATLPGC